MISEDLQLARGADESAGNASPSSTGQLSPGASRPEKRFATVSGSPERVAAAKIESASRARSVGVESSAARSQGSTGRGAVGQPVRQPVARSGRLTACAGSSWRNVTGTAAAAAKKRPSTASSRASSAGQRTLVAPAYGDCSNFSDRCRLFLETPVWNNCR